MNLQSLPSDGELVMQASCWKMLEYASYSSERFAEVVRIALPQLCLPAGRLSSSVCATAACKSQPRSSLEMAEDACLHLVPSIAI